VSPPRLVHFKDNLIREPVTEKIHSHSEYKGEYHPLLSADKPSDQDYKGGHDSSNRVVLNQFPIIISFKFILYNDNIHDSLVKDTIYL